MTVHFKHANYFQLSQNPDELCGITLDLLTECDSVLWHPHGDGEKKWYDHFIDTRKTGHFFDEASLKEWFKLNRSCPTCKLPGQINPPAGKRLWEALIGAKNGARKVASNLLTSASLAGRISSNLLTRASLVGQRSLTTVGRAFSSIKRNSVNLIRSSMRRADHAIAPLLRTFTVSANYSLFRYVRPFRPEYPLNSRQEELFQNVLPAATFLGGAAGALSSKCLTIPYVGAVGAFYLIAPYLLTQTISTIRKNNYFDLYDRITQFTIVHPMADRISYILTMNGLGAGAGLLISPVVGIVNGLAIGTLLGHLLSYKMPSYL